MKSCINQIIILALTITTRSVFAATSSLRGPSFGSSNSNNNNHGLIVDHLLHVEYDAPPPPSSSSSSTIGWKLRSIRQIDTLPGGKYTQIRIIPSKTKAIIVYNGMNADGIQLVSCEDSECNNLTLPRTIYNTDRNPRYIRMELLLESSLPALVYSAGGSTQMKLTVCLNHECTGTYTKSIVLYEQERGRGQELHSNKITVRTNDIVFLSNNSNNNTQKNDRQDHKNNLAAVVFGISNPIDGCKLILAQIQITASSSMSIVSKPNNSNNDDDGDVEIKIVSMMDIVTSPIPFGVNVTKGIFTAGLEFPAIIENNGDIHIAYWDVVNRQLVMIFNVLSSKGEGQQQQRKDVIVMSNTTNTSNPGTFVKILRQPQQQQQQQQETDGVLWLTFYDLILGKMYMVQCNEMKQQCMEPYIIDNNIGDRTLANYGGGGFPSTYNIIVDGDTLTMLEAYFNNNNAESAGQLKLLELTPPTTNTHTNENAADENKSVSYNRNEATTSTNNSSISVIAEGKQGFGRDSSLAYYHRRHDNNNSNSNNNDNDLLFISLLDLQGIDTPETQVAKLAIFERISSSTQEEEIIQEE